VFSDLTPILAKSIPVTFDFGEQDPASLRGNVTVTATAGTAGAITIATNSGVSHVCQNATSCFLTFNTFDKSTTSTVAATLHDANGKSIGSGSFPNTENGETLSLDNSIQTDDAAILKQIFNNNGGANWNISEECKAKWSATTYDSTLCGVTVENKDGKVAGLDLSGFELTGVIPTEIGNLDLLTSLDLSDNFIESFPALQSPNNLPSLTTSFNLSNNIIKSSNAFLDQKAILLGDWADSQITAPTSVKITVATDGFTTSWDASAGDNLNRINGYKLKIGETLGEKIQNASSKELSFDDLIGESFTVSVIPVAGEKDLTSLASDSITFYRNEGYLLEFKNAIETDFTLTFPADCGREWGTEITKDNKNTALCGFSSGASGDLDLKNWGLMSFSNDGLKNLTGVDSIDVSFNKIVGVIPTTITKTDGSGGNISVAGSNSQLLPVTSFAAAIDGDNVKFDWSAQNNSAGTAHIFHSADGGNTFSENSIGSADISAETLLIPAANIPTLNSGTEHYFKIKTFFNNQNEVIYSDVVSISKSEIDAVAEKIKLTTFYDAQKTSGWTFPASCPSGNGKWTDTAFENWCGVTVVNGAITGLNLSNFGLSGELSNTITALSNLKSLNLSDNTGLTKIDLTSTTQVDSILPNLTTLTL
jgi:Leucine-rich repeat (LRR) protein